MGRLSAVSFPAGGYAYVGSAMGGIAARLRHHLRGEKKRHWHIDYLLEEADIIDIAACETGNRTECTLAAALGAQFESIRGFGASDCRCPSHLFFHPDEARMRAGIRAAMASLSLTEGKYLW